jgi:hypothetical protein
MARVLLVIAVLIASAYATTLYEEEVRITKEILGKEKEYFKVIRPPGKLITIKTLESWSHFPHFFIPTIISVYNFFLEKT